MKPYSYLLVTTLLLLIIMGQVEGQTCKPSGKVIGRKPPKGQCNQENDSECCEEHTLYTTYTCSPPITSHTRAPSHSIVSRKAGMAASPRNAISIAIQTRVLWLLFLQDGSNTRKGA
ncbi:hypothetical protein AMTR_s00146p00065400 [Amborella trichopoda]|uniref:Ripening-related protein n=1 Tax=Amborella trichopoda TaxID=13333 RepID=W1PCT0_AMBTC|nr:hypothetical protein AMTR_s00146p00065400 [Amborella trichopoda]